LLVHRSTEARAKPQSDQTGDRSGDLATRTAIPPVGAVPADSARDGVKSST
jgi:hypothetical protein